MNSHQHAASTPRGRDLLVCRVLNEDWKVSLAGQPGGVSQPTLSKWLARFKAEGEVRLHNRTSRPLPGPASCSPEQGCQFAQRRLERAALWRIARESGRSLATVACRIARMGLSRLPALQLRKPIVRYERERPGELLHIDTKRLDRIRGLGHRITGKHQHHNRGIGWDAVHLATDDHSRVSFAAIKPDEAGLPYRSEGRR